MIVSTAAAKTFLSQARTMGVTSRLAGSVRAFASLDAYSDFGKALFKGSVAEEYLSKHGLSASVLDDPTWTGAHADTVAKAVLDW